MADASLNRVKVTLVRSVSDEEQIKFESDFATGDEARMEVRNQLALCRDHMIAMNEQVTLVHREQSGKLDAEIAEKGEKIRALNTEIAVLEEKASKLKKRLSAA